MLHSGNGTYMEKPYQTLDVTSFLPADGGDLLVAIQGLGATGGKAGCAGPCAGIGPKPMQGVLMQLSLELEGGETATVVTDTSWDALDADTYMHPTPGKNWYKHVLEGTNAQHEPLGWRTELTAFKPGAGWAKAGVVLAAAGVPGLHAKMSRPVETRMVPAPTADRITKLDPSVIGCANSYTIDFTREFQGGLILEIEGGVAGQEVKIDAGESLSQLHNRTYTGPVTEKVGSDWGYSFTWTMRDGTQTIEQHEYMEFRFANLCFNGTAPKSFSLSAWAVQYEWKADDYHFDAMSGTEDRSEWHQCRRHAECSVGVEPVHGTGGDPGHLHRFQYEGTSAVRG